MTDTRNFLTPFFWVIGILSLITICFYFYEGYKFESTSDKYQVELASKFANKKKVMELDPVMTAAGVPITTSKEEIKLYFKIFVNEKPYDILVTESEFNRYKEGDKIDILVGAGKAKLDNSKN
ncbi:hypothetical protein HLK66_25555 (plasmid) [Niallia circulans]|uniref:hypothetical protein n=1 Tax=Niallia circulans TaxID=1397 RepID=UPI0011A1A50B|nr:hypothetical protein [Niallia circulans]QJX65056.1 hypothetical protein HLK66_25555 [Niallia circulans]